MRMKKEWRDVIIPNAEWTIQDAVNAFKRFPRMEIEGPWEWGPDQPDWKYTDSVYVFIGDVTAFELFDNEDTATFIRSADEFSVGTWTKTGEKVLCLWWD